MSKESLLRLLLSLLLALALWTYISVKQDPSLAWQYPDPLPVATQGLAQGLTVSNNLSVVRVTIRTDNQNTPVSPSSFHPFVNLTGLGPGLHPALPVEIVADPGIHVVTKTPATMAVDIEQTLTRHVPVHWHILGDPPSGYAVGSIQLDPSTISISGPQSTVDQVADAAVYIDLSQARYSVDGFYKPTAENSQGTSVQSSSRLTLDPQQIHVNATVHAVNDYKSLSILTPIKGQPQPGYGVVGVSVNPSEVTAYGPPRVLNTLSTLQTRGISVSHRGSGSFTRRVPLQLPRGLTTRITSVEITVQLAPVDASSSIQVGITPRNLAPGMTVHTRPASLLVTVVGPSSALSSAARHISATVNVFGYGPGSYALIPSVTAPGKLRVESFYPQTVNVTISSG